MTVEETNSFDTTLETTEGMRFERGYLSAYFVNDADRQEAVLEDPYILLVDTKITNAKELLPVLEKVMQTGKPLFIIAEDVEGEALATLLSTTSEAPSSLSPSRLPALAIAARPC